jgi:putative ABC transport system permease protein
MILGDWTGSQVALGAAASPLVLALALLLILLPFYLVLGGAEIVARAAGWLADASGAFGLPGKLGAVLLGAPKFTVMMFKSVRRNLLRTSLTYLATFMAVLVVSIIWSVLVFLGRVTEERAQDVKVIVTEKFQIPSQMPPRYANDLAAEATGLPPGYAADPAKDLMPWSFVGTSTDPNKRTLDTILFFFALEPKHILTMMEDLDIGTLGPARREQLEKDVAIMQTNKKAVLLGQEKLRAINKRVGDRLKVSSFNYRDIDFDIEIVGVLPPGRYDQNAMMNSAYLKDSLDAYERAKGQRHPLADKSMNLFWARFPDKAGYEKYAEVVSRPGRFSSPAVKVEMASSAIASFLDAYKDILWAMRALLSPAIVAVIVLIVAIAYSISVRERQKEMAVLKVLGFQPWQILVLILGEAILVGIVSGGIGAVGVWFLVNKVVGGVAIPIGFFGKFYINNNALWWGPLVGVIAAVFGSLVPALSARRIRVTDVFSKVA